MLQQMSHKNFKSFKIIIFCLILPLVFIQLNAISSRSTLRRAESLNGKLVITKNENEQLLLTDKNLSTQEQIKENDSQVLTPTILKNSKYRLNVPNADICKEFQLRNGVFKQENVNLTLVDSLTEYQDLNNDGVKDAVAILAYSDGKNDASIFLATVLNQEGEAVNVATKYLGDKLPIDSVLITENKDIIINIEWGNVYQQLSYQFNPKKKDLIKQTKNEKSSTAPMDKKEGWSDWQRWDTFAHHKILLGASNLEYGGMMEMEYLCFGSVDSQNDKKKSDNYWYRVADKIENMDDTKYVEVEVGCWNDRQFKAVFPINGYFLNYE